MRKYNKKKSAQNQLTLIIIGLLADLDIYH